MKRPYCRKMGSLVCALMALSCRSETDDEEARAGTGGSEIVTDLAGQASGAEGVAQDVASAVEQCKSFEGADAEICLSDSRVATPQPVNMLLVLDESGSMSDESTYQGQTKWQAMTDALAAALEGTLEDENLSTNIAFGLELFPRGDLSQDCNAEDCCAMAETPVTVAVGPAATSVPRVIDALRGASPSGLTPTADALEAALAYYTTGQGSTLDGHKYVLLATDGGPNCNGDIACEKEECTQNLDGACGDTDENCCATGVMNLWCVDHARTAATIEKLAGAGVKTIVVGIPGSEAYRQWLDAFADAGDAPAPDDTGAKFYEVSRASGMRGLEETFHRITQNLVHSCKIQLSEDPASYDPWLIKVAVGCKLVPRSVELEDAAGQGGAAGAPATRVKENWRVDATTSPVTIELLGDYCDRAQRGVSRVDVIVDCVIEK